MADALGTPNGVVSDEDLRVDLAGLIAPQTSSLAVRTGVMIAPSATALVTGTSATGTMTVSIAAHHWVTSRSTADGIYLGTLEAATTVNISAAPGSNSRIDVVYVKQNDANSTVSADGSTAPLYGVATGTAAVSPTKPSIPVGATELATVTVAAGATSTNGAGVTIANTARLTAARGAPIPVRNATERDALTGYNGLQVFRLDTGVYETYWSSAWRPSVPDRTWTILAAGAPSFDYAPPTGSWGDLTGISGNVTVPSGRTLDVKFDAPIVQTVGGISYLQLLIDGVQADIDAYQTSSGTGWQPVKLEGSFVGTGASVQVKVQGQVGTGSGAVRGQSLASPVLRYRIN